MEDRRQMTEEEQQRRARNPDLTAMSGFVDTSDLGVPQSVQHVAPIFEVARAHNLAYAARALDEDDEDVPADSVILHEPEPDRDEQRQRVLDASRDATSALDELPTDDYGMLTFDRRAAAEQDWADEVGRRREAYVPPPPPAEPAEPVPVRVPETGADARAEADAATRASAPEAAPEQPSPTPQAAPPGVAQAPAEEPETSEPFPEPEPVSAVPEKMSEESAEAAIRPPNTASSKAAWVAYAITQGADRETAQNMTRADLIEQYNPRKAR